MALRDTILLNSDPVISMTRSLSVVLTGFEATTIRKALNDHAFPRIRFRLLSATRATQTEEGGTNKGVSVWFDDLKDLSDPAKQADVDNLIDTMITSNPLMRDSFNSIAARLAGSLLINSQTSIVENLAKHANTLEAEAMKDLEKLIRTPFFEQAVDAARESAFLSLRHNRIYMALAPNDDIETYNGTTNVGAVHVGAAVRGQATLWIGLDSVTVSVDEGDTPGIVLNKLAAAWRTTQTTRNGLGMDPINVVLAPDAGVDQVAGRYVLYQDYTDPDEPEEVGEKTPAFKTPIGFISVSPYLYDKDVDFLPIILELKSETVEDSDTYDKPNIKGLIFGTNSRYRTLTAEGPHSIIIDLTTGERSSLDSPSGGSDDESSTLSNTFYFQVSNDGVSATGSIAVSGTFLEDDVATITIDDVDFTYTVDDGDTNSDIATALAALVHAHADYTATATSSTVNITVVAEGTAGNLLTLETSVTSDDGVLTETAFSGGLNENTLLADGDFVYRSQEMVDTRNSVPTGVSRTRTISLTQGMSALDIVVAVANDIASFSSVSRILGAIRAPTTIYVAGSPRLIPGLSIIPYTRDAIHYNIVFDVLEVPFGLEFAALPQSLIVDPSTIFDSYPKSLVLPARMYGLTANAGSSGVEDDQSSEGTLVAVVKPIHSKSMKKAFSAWADFDGGI